MTVLVTFYWWLFFVFFIAAAPVGLGLPMVKLNSLLSLSGLMIACIVNGCIFTASRVAVGRVWVRLRVFRLLFYVFPFLFFFGVAVLLVTPGSCPQLGPSEMLSVFLWLVLFLGYATSFGFTPGCFILIPPCRQRYLWSFLVQKWLYSCQSILVGCCILFYFFVEFSSCSNFFLILLQFWVCFHCMGKFWLFSRIWSAHAVTYVLFWIFSEVPSVLSVWVPCIPVVGLFVYNYICAWCRDWVIVLVEGYIEYLLYQ